MTSNDGEQSSQEKDSPDGWVRISLQVADEGGRSVSSTWTIPDTLGSAEIISGIRLVLSGAAGEFGTTTTEQWSRSEPTSFKPTAPKP